MEKIKFDLKSKKNIIFTSVGLAILSILALHLHLYYCNYFNGETFLNRCGAILGSLIVLFSFVPSIFDFIFVTSLGNSQLIANPPTWFLTIQTVLALIFCFAIYYLLIWTLRPLWRKIKG